MSGGFVETAVGNRAFIYLSTNKRDLVAPEICPQPKPQLFTCFPPSTVASIMQRGFHPLHITGITTKDRAPAGSSTNYLDPISVIYVFNPLFPTGSMEAADSLRRCPVPYRGKHLEKP